MGRAERYREHAEQCWEFSKSVDDPTWRAQLVAMAAQWRELADWESRGGPQQPFSRFKAEASEADVTQPA
jgi:hypothetical protein